MNTQQYNNKAQGNQSRQTVPFPLSDLEYTPFKNKQVRLTKPTVNIQKNGSLSVSSGLVRRERLFFHQFVKVGYDKSHNALILTFTKRPGYADDKFPTNKRNDRFTINLKGFFTWFGVDLSKNLGTIGLIKYKEYDNEDKIFIVALK